MHMSVKENKFRGGKMMREENTFAFCLIRFLCFCKALMTVTSNKTLSDRLSRKGSKCNFI